MEHRHKSWQGQSYASSPSENGGNIGWNQSFWNKYRDKKIYSKYTFGINRQMEINWYYKVMTNLNSILKSRDITLPTKVCLVKAMVFSVVMYGCGTWTVKKAEC